MDIFIKISGWLIALLSLIVNYLQYKENKKLSISINEQKMENSSETTQQNHSGNGDNIAIKKGNVYKNK